MKASAKPPLPPCGRVPHSCNLKLSNGPPALFPVQEKKQGKHGSKATENHCKQPTHSQLPSDDVPTARSRNTNPGQRLALWDQGCPARWYDTHLPLIGGQFPEKTHCCGASRKKIAPGFEAGANVGRHAGFNHARKKSLLWIGTTVAQIHAISLRQIS